jgi:ubiquinone/menaquinone biosynthesis C-methylase UbiE
MTQKLQAPSNRTLDRDVPELREYLKPGDKVLDIGCGPGTITVDVAEAVSPGEVVGVDPVEADIATARQWASQAAPGARVSFCTGDAHELPFADDSFDVVYSHTVAHSLLDPVRALREQRRVTRPGGWVVASGVRDAATPIRYPRCPNWEKAWEALGRCNEAVAERFRSSGEDPTQFLRRELEHEPTFFVYFDHQAARKCPHAFAQAGLRDLRVRVKADWIQFPGANTMRPSPMDMLPVDEAAADTPTAKHINIWSRRIVEDGYIDLETLDRARQEARAWYQDPRAFSYWLLVFVAGRR